MPFLNSVHEFGSDRYSCKNTFLVTACTVRMVWSLRAQGLDLHTRCCCLRPRRKLLLDSAVGETCSFMGMKWASLYYVELCLKPPAWVYGVVYALLKLAAAAGAKYAPQVANHPSLKAKGSEASARRRWLACGLGSCWFAACLALHISGVPFNAVPKASEFLQFEERTNSMCAATISACRDRFLQAAAHYWHSLLLLASAASASAAAAAAASATAAAVCQLQPLLVIQFHLHPSRHARCCGVLVIQLQVRHGAGHVASSSTRRSRLSLGMPTTAVPYGNPPSN